MITFRHIGAALLAVCSISSTSSAEAPAASLRVNGDRATFMVTVTDDRAVGYRIAIDCIARCPRAIQYHETSGDSPLGLFSRDQDDLIFSVWSAGSVYRVLVWSVAQDHVRKVGELSSRGRPDFLSNPEGNAMIRTYEADGGNTPPVAVSWTVVNGHFLRHPADIRARR